MRTHEKLYPWNFDQVVDRARSAQRFIERMTDVSKRKVRFTVNINKELDIKDLMTSTSLALGQACLLYTSRPVQNHSEPDAAFPDG